MKFERPFGRIRNERGMHLEAAAAMLRISARYLRRLELGKVPLSWGLAHRMCSFYGVGLDELTRLW